MKKHDLKKLALLGLSSGLMIAQHLNAEDATPVDVDEEGNRGYHLMNEDELMLELSDQGVALYKSLSPEGKELARKVASQRCNGTNECKGLGACRTDKHECAGKNDCKGQSKCAFSSKDLAVKVVAEKMAEKRKSLTN